jgi:hypothetical protein
LTRAPVPFRAASGPESRPEDATELPGLALLAWTAFLAGSLLLLHAVGGTLAPPPLTDPSGWAGWFDARQPAEAVVALLRVLALGLAWYLMAATVTGTALRLAGAARLVPAADALTVPLVRQLVNGAFGLSLAAVTLSGTAGAAPAAGSTQPRAAVETMERLPDEAGGAPAPTMRRLPDQDSAGATPSTIAPRPAAVPAGGPDGPDGPDGPRTWEVRPGDHFWGVAERILTEVWQGAAPTDAEVDPYWRAVVEANRSMLRDPANPDLLFPGQVITVPPPPARPS